MIAVSDRGDCITFSVRVRPRASRSALAGEIDGALGIRLAAPPVDGAANEELIRLLSSVFSVPRSRISIISGLSSRNKVVRIEGVSVVDFMAAINSD